MNHRSKVAITILLGAIALFVIACHPTTVILEITNEAGQDIDFIYAEDFIDLRDFGRDYDSLEIGDTDTYQGCTQCDIAHGETYSFDTPLTRRQSVVFAARESATERVIFKARYTYEELREVDWAVRVVDQS